MISDKQKQAHLLVFAVENSLKYGAKLTFALGPFPTGHTKIDVVILIFSW